MTTTERKEIERQICNLEEQKQTLLAKLNSTKTISPSVVKTLIKKYHGKCFSFDGEESGAVDFKLNTFEIKRRDDGVVDKVYVDGTFIIYFTPDCSLFYNNDLHPDGGRIICEGRLDMDNLPYVDILGVSMTPKEDAISERISKTLDGAIISNEKFDKELEDVDDSWDSYGSAAFEGLEEMTDSIRERRVYAHI